MIPGFLAAEPGAEPSSPGVDDPVDIALAQSGLLWEDDQEPISLVELAERTNAYAALTYPWDPVLREIAFHAGLKELGKHKVSEAECRSILRAAFDSARNGFRTCRNKLVAPLLSELREAGAEADWVVPGLLGRGVVTLVAGHPKAGKTTWVANLLTAALQAERHQAPPAALWVDLEQSRSLTLRLFRSLGALDLPIRLLSSPGRIFSLEQLQGLVTEAGSQIVVIDSLSKWWAGLVEDENDASQVETAVGPLVRLAREANTAIVLIHHNRKSGGRDGLDVRGSTAVTAAVDIIISFRRRGIEGGRERLLELTSRYAETPSKLILELRDGRYQDLGTAGWEHQLSQQERINAALDKSWQDSEAIACKSKIKSGTARTILKNLVRTGKAEESGEGKKGNPFLYRTPAVSSAGSEPSGAEPRPSSREHRDVEG